MKRLCITTAFLFVAVSTASGAMAADTLKGVKKKGFLAVGVRDNTPPMSFLDTDKGKIVGVEIDLVTAIAKKIGVPLKLVPITAAERVQVLHEGKVDLVAASFSKTPDRAKLVDFSLTYFKARQRILAKKGVVKTLKDLERKKIAVVKGTTSEKNLREMVPSATVLPLSNMKYVIDVLSRGEVDIVSGDGVTLYGYLMTASKEKKDQFEIVKDIALADEPYGMAVRLGDKKFLDLVNGVLTDLKNSGEAEKIFAKWLRGAPGTSAPAAAAKKAARAEAPPPAPPGPKAGGAVVRKTGAAGRYVIITLKGVFREGTDVTIYDFQGEVVCKGKVQSVYGDDVYVDAIGPRAEEVAAGFGVGMGLSDKEAKKLVLARKNVLQNVKTESKKEAEARQKEIAADYKADQVQRREQQEQFQQTKMQLDYQYDDSWGWGHNGSWGGYRW
jgi:polar amino acid transport system substrate-binding protein